MEKKIVIGRERQMGGLRSSTTTKYFRAFVEPFRYPRMPKRLVKGSTAREDELVQGLIAINHRTTPMTELHPHEGVPIIVRYNDIRRGLNDPQLTLNAWINPSCRHTFDFRHNCRWGKADSR